MGDIGGVRFSIAAPDIDPNAPYPSRWLSLSLSGNPLLSLSRTRPFRSSIPAGVGERKPLGLFFSVRAKSTKGCNVMLYARLLSPRPSTAPDPSPGKTSCDPRYRVFYGFMDYCFR